MYRVKAQSELLWHRISATHVSAFLSILLRYGWQDCRMGLAEKCGAERRGGCGGSV